MKIVLPFALAAAALAVATPVAAQPYSFTHDGIRFEVEETYDGSDRLLVGSDSTGASFSVRVRGRQVTGTYRGSQIAFRMPAPKPEKVASR